MNTLPHTTSRRKLPIGMQTFAKLREEGCYYVDKTGMVLDLIASGSAFFLSRPRRFGKSLLVDTFKELFEGNRPLFDRLAAEMRWDWTRRYPVIRISFAGGEMHSRAELDQRLGELIDEHAERQGVTLRNQSLAGRFEELIRRTHARTGERVVVLVDEYDKPILDNLGESTVAKAMREGLKNLYSVLKGADEHLKFVFLTGVSKFSKVSLFSGLNHLIDLTLDPRYSGLCGYTDVDVDTVFAPELPGLDREEIRRWYNGYNWRGTGVYNPFDLLLLFDRREFHPYWFETGTPTFLVNLLTERRMHTPDLGRLVASETLLSTFDVDTIPSEALLFQAGYLTIASVHQQPGRLELTLKYPNQEVQASLNESLLQRLSGDLSVPGAQISRLWNLLQAGDPLALKDLFHAFFASIPNDWYRNSPIAQFEGYWASVFYSHFAALGLDIRVEDTTNKGRIDMVVLACGAVWVFEFKVVELVPAGKAIEQIRQKGYGEKYRDRGEPMHLIGVEFSRVDRNIVAFDCETQTSSHSLRM